MPLPAGYEWCVVDMQDNEQANEVYTLLSNHYVEDIEGKFRFDYSINFLRWAINPPGYYQDWIVGVRGQGKLCGFITAIPIQMIVGGTPVNMAEVNFLCVHKKLREKRMAPLLIKEVTRRVNLRDQWQAIYTSGTTLPTPWSTAQYWHRNLNPQKLVDINFAYRPPEMSQAKYNKMHKLPNEILTPDLKPMTEADVPKATVALNRHLLENYKAHIIFTEADVRHFLCPREGVVYAWFVEDDEGITDFISFYALNSSILNDAQHDKIYAAYAFYNFVKDNNKMRMNQLMRDLLILAKNNNFDVFNMTEVLQHGLVRGDLMLVPGSGKLCHYFFNWRMQVCDSEQIGIVLV